MVISMLISCSTLQAATNQIGDSVNFKFSGSMQIATTPCKINDDRPISVEFGNVAINRVETGEYIRPIDYIMDCGSATSSQTISMIFKASSVPSDLYSFNSNLPGLWMKVLKDGKPLELNKSFNVPDLNNPPKLQIQLVKNPDIDLIESGFMASGTLAADYL